MLILKKWYNVLYLDAWLAVARRIVKGLCWKCGGRTHPEDAYQKLYLEHIPGCTGQHLSENPWLRLRWGLAMVPLGVVALLRTLLGILFVALLMIVGTPLVLLGFVGWRDLGPE